MCKLLADLARDVGLDTVSEGPTDEDEPGSETEPYIEPGPDLAARRASAGHRRATCPDVVRSLVGDDEVDIVWTDPPYGVSYEGTAGTIVNDDLPRGRPARASRAVIRQREGGPPSAEHPTVKLSSSCDARSPAHRGEAAPCSTRSWGQPSTLIAAETIGRRCLGIELDPATRRPPSSGGRAFTGSEAQRG